MIWTLQRALGGPEKTLAEWGFSGATRTNAVQGEDVVTLTRPVADAATEPDLWPWETELILRRDGEVYYRGFLDNVTRSFSPEGESQTYPLRSLWWLLSRTTYRQSWPALTGADMGTVMTSRVRLGDDEDTAASMLAALSAYAATLGIGCHFDVSAIPGQRIPPVEGHNRTIAELVRAILRWFPDAALVPVYAEDGTFYQARLSSSTPVEVIDVGGAPLASLDITPLSERQVDAVQIIYEATAIESTFDPSEADGEGGLSSAPRLVAAVDLYPPAAAITRRTLTITLPHPSPPGGQRQPQPQVMHQPIVSKKWPEDGAVDEEAQQWWLDRSDLGTMGLTVADIMLPSTSDAHTMAHRVKLDPADREVPPSPVNPRSEPKWKPTVPAKVPRELLSGGIADWMPGRMRSYRLIAEATLAVKKSAVAALAAEDKAAFLRLNPRERKINSIAAYLIDGHYSFTGTNALTKIYSKTISINYGGVESTGGASASNLSNYHEAVRKAKIPGLAWRLYQSLSPLHYQGSLPLITEEAPLTSYLGRRICLSHPSRPEWATMAAQVSQERVDLFTGTVGLTFGPPPHLEAADWQALHSSAQASQRGRGESAAGPQPTAGDPDATPDPDEAPRNATFGASITPVAAFRTQGGAPPKRPWDIVPDEETTFKLWAPQVIWKRDEVTATITVTNTPFTPATGKYLVAVISSLSSPAISIELLATGWEGYPSAYEFAGEDNDFVTARIPLWHFTATESEGALEIITGVWAKKQVASDVLRLVFPLFHVPTTTDLRSVPDLL